MKKMKKISYRTCIGCHKKKEKKELLRIIRTPEGKVEIDTTGKKSGRGAYLCYNLECLKEALKKDRLKKALMIEISTDIIDSLKEKYKEIQDNSKK